MKNRTVIGIICMVLAVIVTFAVAPFVNRITSGNVAVICLSTNVKQGTMITENQIETVKINRNCIPENAIKNKADIVGKYAVSDLYKSDIVTSEKITAEANTANDVFASLDGTKVAMSITIDTFAAGLSGKLQNGDVISLVVVNKETGTATIPAELKYVKVITTTTSGGIDKNDIVENEDGSFELPSTVTVLVNTSQAKLLAEYESKKQMQTVLVYRGEKGTADKFIEKQDEFFKNGGEKLE